MYRQLFGEHLFHDPDYFPVNDKYTLDPLRDGEDALVCHDMEGLESIALTELHIMTSSAYNDRTIYKSRNLFASMKGKKQSLSALLRDAILVEAKFQVKFDRTSKPRTLSIKPPNVASFGRKEDVHTIEQWMIARGFIKPVPLDADEHAVSDIHASVA